MTNPEPIQALSERADYAVLRAYGHSPFVAAQICLDADQGAPSAVDWLRIVRSTEAGRAAIAEIEGDKG